MQYSRASSSQISSPDLLYLDEDPLYYSPAFSSTAKALYDPLFSEYSQNPQDYLDLMSAASFDFNNASQGLDQDSTSQDSAALYNLTAQQPSLADFSLSNAAFQGAWSQTGPNPFQPQNQHLAVPGTYQGHRRALSNASSYGAPDSPFSRASSVQYPSAYPQGPQYMQQQQQAPAMWDNGYSSPSSGVQHLPTPSHTPKSDVQMELKPAVRTASLSRNESDSRSVRSVVPQAYHSRYMSADADDRSLHRHSSGGHAGPPTPGTMNGDHDDAHSGAQIAGEPGLDSYLCLDDSQDYNAASRHLAHTPAFVRTISDACQDELYNPNHVTSAPTMAQRAQYQQQVFNPHNNLIFQRLNDAHMTRGSNLADVRQASPFRAGATEAYAQQPQPQSSAAQADPRAKPSYMAHYQQFQQQQQQQQPRSDAQPQTISPKDAFPKENAPDDENMPSLFPAQSSQEMSATAMYAPHNANAGHMPQQQQHQSARPSVPSGGQYGFATPSIPSSSQDLPEFPAHLVSMETTKSESNSDEGSVEEVQRPVDTSSGSGTYTCTYHGCTERFTTPSLLQKHKREAHRSTGAGGAAAASAMTPAQQQMTQAGPHKCSRINPSTGKPCNVVFSRPYDLTRHEDTIHAERKKVRCPHCTEEKTFSRADALTRHLRVVHPHVSFPGKHRRRAN